MSSCHIRRVSDEWEFLSWGSSLLSRKWVISLGMKTAKKRQKVVMAIFFAIGLGVFLYPTLSNLYVEQFQNQIIDAYQDKVDQMTKDEKAQKLRNMIAYNEELSQEGTAYTDPFAGIFDSESAASEEDNNASVKETTESSEPVVYDALSESVGESLGHIEIPKIGIDIPIYIGTSEKVLQEGIGLLEGSSLPVGGASTHATLTGHNGLPSAKLFTDLHKLKEGDIFYIHALNDTLAYEVDTIQTVLPDETASLKIVEGKDLVTLITCTPYMVNTHRLLVTGHRVPYEAVDEVAGRSQAKAAIAAEDEADYFGMYGKSGMAVAFVFVVMLLYAIKRKKGGGINDK